MSDESDKAPEPVKAPTLSSEVAKAFKSGFKFGAFFSLQLGIVFTLLLVALLVNSLVGRWFYVRPEFVLILVLSLIFSSIIFYAFIKSTSTWRSVASKPWQKVVIGCAIVIHLFLIVFGILSLIVGQGDMAIFIIGILVALLVLALGGGLVGAVMLAIAASLSDRSDLEEESKHPLD